MELRQSRIAIEFAALDLISVRIREESKQRKIPVIMLPRPAMSLVLVPPRHNLDGASPPPILVCPSSSWPIVPLCPPAAVMPKQHVELHGEAVTAVARARETR
jgi:hypothetical protein